MNLFATMCGFSARWMLASVSLVLSAHAHETWLLPSGPALAGRPLTLQLTSSMAFPKLDYALQPARVPAANLRLSGVTTELKLIKRGAHALDIKATPASPGVATAWVALPEKFISLSAAKVGEYFDEIDAQAEIREAWKKQPSPKQWREFYRKSAKAVFVVKAAGGETAVAASDNSWREPVGEDLELIPLTHLATFASGNAFVISVMRNGQPVPQFSLSLARHGAKPARTKTDDKGEATFVLDGSGPWLIYGTSLKPATRANAEWESEFATLTLTPNPQNALKH